MDSYRSYLCESGCNDFGQNFTDPTFYINIHYAICISLTNHKKHHRLYQYNRLPPNIKYTPQMIIFTTQRPEIKWQKVVFINRKQ